MAVTVQDLMNQLAEDESRQLQLQQYLDAAEIWVKNAVTSEEDSLFFKEEKIIPLVDLAIISYAIGTFGLIVVKLYVNHLLYVI
ncbi:hypothetical protein ACN9TB_08200 [Lactococcus lactis]